MEPAQGKATLVDLLDRALDKGLVIHADIIISVAGIPLVGLNLRAVLAGVETMLEYGMLQGMKQVAEEKVSLGQDERLSQVIR